MPRPAHQQLITDAFTAQATLFSASAVANADEILDAIIKAAQPRAEQRWIETACGPGIVSRRLAPLVASVHGVDLTPQMIEIARHEAATAGAGNADFELADATATGLASDSFDGAVTRFSLHHIPLPGRLVAEMARLTRPGGRVVIADHLADEDAEVRAWTQEIERLRDPSHWASLSAARLRALTAQAGLEQISEQVVDFDLDFDDWLLRGTADAHARELVELALPLQPAPSDAFRVQRHAGRRLLTLKLFVGAFTPR